MGYLPSYSSLSPRDWSVSTKLIALVAPLLLLFVMVTAWYFAGTQRVQAVEQQVNSAARSFLNQVRADREYYASVVVPRLLKLNARVRADYHQVPNAFPLPVTFLREATEMAARTPSAYRIRLVSPWPINKQNGVEDAFQKEGFRALMQSTEGFYSRRDTVDGTTILRYLSPERAVVKSCVDCHNAHPDSPKHDFRLNDLMGGIEVNVPIEAQMKTAQRDQLLLLWASTGVCLILMALLVWGTRRVVTRPVLQLTREMETMLVAKEESGERLGTWAETAMGQEVRALWQQFRETQKAIRVHLIDRNVQLQRQTEKHQMLSQRLLELQQITQVMQQSTSEEEVYRILGHTLRQVLPLKQILILRLNASEDRLELVWSSPKRADMGLNSYPVWDNPSNCPVIRSGREYMVKDLRHDLTCSFSISNGGDGAYWCVPLVIGARTIGVVHLVSSVTHCWTQDASQWIESIVNIAAPMIGHLQHLERAKRRALIDELTGAYNRRFLEEFLAKIILPDERRKGQLVSLLIIDLDHFKPVNDTYGHQVGDLVLKAVASTMHRILKESDVLARYGGEEFVVVLPRTSTVEAVSVAERLRLAVADLSLRKLATLAPDHITISAGVATYPTHAITVEDLIRTADEALYQAKSLGRNRVVCTTTEAPAGPRSSHEQG